MQVLLLSMPDSFEHMPSIGVRMPNGALSSIAGNIDEHHTVGIADLILKQKNVRQTVTELLENFQPDVVGLSVMTFQRKTAKTIISLIRQLRPQAHIVAGGYDPSLAPEAYTSIEDGADFIVRGEGEVTFCELLRTLEKSGDFSTIPGLSYRVDRDMQHNPNRPVSTLSNDRIRPPRRNARILSGYEFLGNIVDVVETSRGCTFDCGFCSIIEMRGRNFFTYSIQRVIADIQDAYDRGARSIFFVDDNIGLNVHRFEQLCQAIIDAGLNQIEYIVQAMTSTIANHGTTLAPLMAKAGFKYVFLGIENILEDDLKFLKASAKNYKRENGKRAGNATIQAIEFIHRNGMYVVGGLIVGNPDDTADSILANLDFVKQYVDYPYIQHPTPYPRTPMSTSFEADGLILNRPVEEFDGTTAVVRTKHMDAQDIEFLRWRAERWIKFRHMFAVFRDRYRFVLRNAFPMFAYTFRGSSWRTFLGLENERRAFERYRALRAKEREYL
jgi:anaerobic magnesium-protoporphyrin IX monomethyl ester cyclase